MVHKMQGSASQQLCSNESTKTSHDWGSQSWDEHPPGNGDNTIIWKATKHLMSKSIFLHERDEVFTLLNVCKAFAKSLSPPRSLGFLMLGSLYTVLRRLPIQLCTVVIISPRDLPDNGERQQHHPLSIESVLHSGCSN